MAAVVVLWLVVQVTTKPVGCTLGSVKILFVIAVGHRQAIETSEYICAKKNSAAGLRTTTQFEIHILLLLSLNNRLKLNK